MDLAGAKREPGSVPSTARPKRDWDLERVWVVKGHGEVAISLVVETEGDRCDRKETEESTVKDGEGDKSDLDEGW